MEENEYSNSNQPSSTPPLNQEGQTSTQQPNQQQPYNWQPEQSQYQSQQTYTGASGQQNQPYMQYEQPPKPSVGMGVASMVLGIVSIVLCCFWYVSVVCAIVGLVLGIISVRKGAGKGMGIAGIVLSSISLLLILLLLVGRSTSSYTDFINEFSEAFEEGYNSN